MPEIPAELADFNIVHPEHYAAKGYPHDVWAWMRREDPVHWVENNEGKPYWAVTRHEDITLIGKTPEVFLNAPRITVNHLPEPEQTDMFPATLIQMDPPKHRAFRQLISRRFTPRALKKLHEPIEQIGKEIVDALIGESALPVLSDASGASSSLPRAASGGSSVWVCASLLSGVLSPACGCANTAIEIAINK